MILKIFTLLGAYTSSGVHIPQIYTPIFVHNYNLNIHSIRCIIQSIRFEAQEAPNKNIKKRGITL